MVKTKTGTATSGLIHPVDIGDWHSWQDDRRRLALLVHRRRTTPGISGVLTSRSSSPQILIVLDGTTPSHVASLLAPLARLQPDDIALLAPTAHPELFADDCETRTVGSSSDLDTALPSVTVGVSAGGFLPLSALAHEFFDRRGVRSFVIQHGLVTPFSPPLPAGTTLLAWSDADGEFWRSGREDIETHTVGSQLLWEASEQSCAPVDPDDGLTFLGQLHGVELSRIELFRLTMEFCQGTGAHYRPHPSERDRASRIAHQIMRARGIPFADSSIPLTRIGTPVVAVFSSGILEAAALGMPAWGYHPDPEEWITEFWERNRISPWGSEPTPPPERPSTEPAVQIARVLKQAVEEIR